ncbi:hypothetical protein L1987_21812 [Smallanthus sonchifolius]|uniref:Uncharacterized protein n=1 Tax=Smallanthus sonchifolius TaxID=185202 RepID=A0ACB9IDA4_9ASTR|nr:hypothetical protein L1987_21812 [Smallanthus sonchifolius]
MKFCKKYEEYMQSQDQKKPGVGFKNLKKILKRCRRDVSHSPTSLQSQSSLILGDSSDKTSESYVHPCSVCDGSFFPSLMKEMFMVVGCFNERAQKVLDVHLATGFKKYFVWCKDKFQGNHGALIQEGKDLVGYAIINAIAMRKILKKYDKIHDSNQGQAFRSQVQSMHMDILQSPWLCELIALHINLRETKGITGNGSELFESCFLIFNDGKPSLSCELSDAVKLEIDLTCSICLDTVFDPAGVYQRSLHLDELNILLGQSCPKYWEERLKTERAERIRQTKEHWESQSRAFLGI